MSTDACFGGGHAPRRPWTPFGSGQGGVDGGGQLFRGEGLSQE